MDLHSSCTSREGRIGLVQGPQPGAAAQAGVALATVASASAIASGGVGATAVARAAHPIATLIVMYSFSLW